MLEPRLPEARLAAVAGAVGVPGVVLFLSAPEHLRRQLCPRRGQRRLAPFAEVLRSPALRSVLAFTFLQAVISTLLTLLLGLPGAFLLARYEFRGKSLSWL